MPASARQGVPPQQDRAQSLSCRDYQHGLVDVDLRKLALQVRDLRQIVIDNIGIARISYQKILMVGLGWIEPFQRHHLGHDRSTEYLGVVQLLDVRIRNPLLLCA